MFLPYKEHDVKFRMHDSFNIVSTHTHTHTALLAFLNINFPTSKNTHNCFALMTFQNIYSAIVITISTESLVDCLFVSSSNYS